MRNHRFKCQTAAFGMFAGVTARAVLTPGPPGTAGQIGRRLWLDTSHVKDRLRTDEFRDEPLPLSEREVESLRPGLRWVAEDIEAAEPDGHVVIRVEALEIVPVDYIEEALAPAIAGWAAEEFGFTPYHIKVSLDETARQYSFEWSR